MWGRGLDLGVIFIMMIFFGIGVGSLFWNFMFSFLIGMSSVRLSVEMVSLVGLFWGSVVSMVVSVCG